MPANEPYGRAKPYVFKLTEAATMHWRRLGIAVAGLACVAIYVFLEFILEFRYALAISAVVAGVVMVYSAISPKPLSERKPWICWFPKYRFRCRLSQSFVTSAERLGAVARRLGELGFKVHRETSRAMKLTRGYPKGDFSIELAKVDVTIRLPIEEELDVLLVYGWVALFDTGDLWRLAQEIRRRLRE